MSSPRVYRILASCWLLAFLLVRVQAIEDESGLQWFARIMNTYDRSLHPESDGAFNHTMVQIRLLVDSVGNLQIKTMDFDIDMFVVETWQDKRLQHNHSIPYLFNEWEHVNKFWRPDTYLAFSKAARYNEVTVPNMSFKIQKDGKVRFSVRVSGTIACFMDLRRYPFDSQICRLQILSYGNTADTLRLGWRTDGPGVVVNDENPEADFKLDGSKGETAVAEYDGARYTKLIAVFFFSRTRSQYFLQVYAPSIVIVMISWISFWIDPKMVPGRVGLCVTTLLTLSTQAAGISFSLPRVGYAKALDVWMGVCLLYLFGSLIEFALVNSLQQIGTARKEQAASNGLKHSLLKKDKTDEANGTGETELLTNDTGVGMGVINAMANKISFYSWHLNMSIKIDELSRYMFPATFAIFVVVYCVYYLIITQEDTPF